MKMIVGLGNPGPKYETTRHNVGFLALDRLIERWNAQGPNTAYEGEIYTTSVGGEKVLLIKPQTYMNVSGRCVGPLFKFYKCQPTDMIVIHDDLDLNPITLRIKTGGGTGGHNGLKSIDEHLGAALNGYHRIRIGIGHPSKTSAPGAARAVVDYVLQPFSDAELDNLDPLLDNVAEAVEKILRGDVRGAMTEFNREKKD
jgi:PTH1 family peptidyl-tRNA hydrolase